MFWSAGAPRQELFSQLGGSNDPLQHVLKQKTKQVNQSVSEPKCVKNSSCEDMGWFKIGIWSRQIDASGLQIDPPTAPVDPYTAPACFNLLSKTITFPFMDLTS